MEELRNVCWVGPLIYYIAFIVLKGLLCKWGRQTGGPRSVDHQRFEARVEEVIDSAGPQRVGEAAPCGVSE